jgi:hypothetical protein
LAYRKQYFGGTCYLCLREARGKLKSFYFKRELLGYRVGYINTTLQILPPLLSYSKERGSRFLLNVGI